MSITVTEKATQEIKRVMDEQDFTPETHMLEVGVVGGGCSGFSYALGFKEVEKLDPLNETVIDQFGLQVAIANKAIPLMEGTVIDFHSGLDKRGFTFANPLATKGCGCGNSFSA
jgi:iron-sulfur cluster assembly accessory protein